MAQVSGALVGWWPIQPSHNPEAEGLRPGCVRKSLQYKTIAKSFVQVHSMWQFL